MGSVKKSARINVTKVKRTAIENGVGNRFVLSLFILQFFKRGDRLHHEIIKYLHQKSNNSFPIIGVGGIHSAEDALEKINAGASLIQLYTGFIYEGPALIKKINKLLLK